MSGNVGILWRTHTECGRSKARRCLCYSLWTGIFTNIHRAQAVSALVSFRETRALLSQHTRQSYTSQNLQCILSMKWTHRNEHAGKHDANQRNKKFETRMNEKNWKPTIIDNLLKWNIIRGGERVHHVWFVLWSRHAKTSIIRFRDNWMWIYRKIGSVSKHVVGGNSSHH